MFNKGDRVTTFGTWDEKGTVTICTGWVVYSCGKKRMVIVSERGEKFGKAALDPNGGRGASAWGGFKLRPASTDADDEAFALAFAEDCLRLARAHFEGCIARYTGGTPGYVASVQADIDALHEPRIRRIVAGDR